jgi:hypothetical protein
MNDNDVQPVNFSVDPNKTPVYFADGFVISSNEQAVSLSFSQAVADGKQQNIIARIAMTNAQSKEFLKTLNDHLEKYER